MIARALSASVIALLLLAPSSRARADGPFEGEWRQGQTSIDVRVETWGPDCGPRPQSSTVPGRGTVRVTQEGDHLSFGGRRSTRGCWSDNRAVRVVSSRVQSGSWQILCRTPPDDPRRETGTYTLRSSGNERLELTDETDYDWTLNESHCTARVTTRQSFERVGGPTPPPTTSTPNTSTPPPTTSTPPATPEPPCTPGAPARVSVRPPSSEVAVGERVCFSARVVDERGCAVRSREVELSLASGGIGALRGSCLEVTSAGGAVIVARSEDLEARATVRARSEDLSGLTARNDRNALGAEEASAGQDSGVAARTASTTAVSPWLLVVAGFAVVLAGLAAVALSWRSRRLRAHRAERAQQERASYAASASLPPAAATPGASPSPEAMICPICRRGYPAGASACAKDQERLVPYAEFVMRREQGVPERVCPTCGTRYPGTTKFCGKDGTTLG
jgi:hypothetical protein